MRYLWIGFMAFAAYGSLYPFDFRAGAVDRATIDAFLASCCSSFSRGDALANVVLFVPIGVFGVLAGRRSPVPSQALSRVPGRRLVLVALAGLFLALALQVAQLYLPGRVPSLQDVVWNTIGLIAGLLAGLCARRLTEARTSGTGGVALAPLAPIAPWLAYKLMPFVPSFNVQGIKNSLKPLLLHPELNWIGFAHDAVAWLVVAYLLAMAAPHGRLDRLLPPLILVTFAMEVLIVDNRVSLTNVAGAGAALLLWFAVLRPMRRRRLPGQPEILAGLLAGLLAAVIVTNGLQPFVLREEAVAFSWLPFRGFLGGSMVVNAQVALEKAFLYASLVYLLWQSTLGQSTLGQSTLGQSTLGQSTLGRTPIGRATGTAAALALVAAVEIAQTRLAGHFPEITDPLLVVLAAGALLALRRRSDVAR